MIAKRSADRNLWHIADRFDYVTAGTCSDIENSHRTIVAMHFQNQISQSLFKIRFALPNATPADAIQVRFVDKPAKCTPAVRFVLVDVIERKPGIETTRQPISMPPLNRPASFSPARATENLALPFFFKHACSCAVYPLLSAFTKEGAFVAFAKQISNEFAHKSDNVVTIRFVKDRVISVRENLEALVS